VPLRREIVIGSALLGALVAVAGPATSAPAAEPASEAAPARARVSCPEYRKAAESTAGHSFVDTRLKPGSWANIPAPLRRLPRRAKSCGANGAGQVVIVSPLFGKTLEEHYAPLFAKLGCAPLRCDVAAARTICRCKAGRDIGTLVTDTGNQAFIIGYMRRGPDAGTKRTHD
jgi:hypothetical protein